MHAHAVHAGFAEVLFRRSSAHLWVLVSEFVDDCSELCLSLMLGRASHAPNDPMDPFVVARTMILLQRLLHTRSHPLPPCTMSMTCVCGECGFLRVDDFSPVAQGRNRGSGLESGTRRDAASTTTGTEGTWKAGAFVLRFLGTGGQFKTES